MADKDEFLECGLIANTHGVHGAVVIDSWCDSVEIFCSLPSVYIQKKDGYKEYKIVSASKHKNRALVKFEGVDEMNDAILLKNKVVFAKRQDLPLDEGAAFIADMIGLDVFRSGSDEKLGKLCDVIESVASDIYVVKRPDGSEVLVPAVDEFIDEIDVERGIWISPISGMFEE